MSLFNAANAARRARRNANMTHMVKPLTKRGKVSAARPTQQDWAFNAFDNAEAADKRREHLERTTGRGYAVVELRAKVAPQLNAGQRLPHDEEVATGDARLDRHWLPNFPKHEAPIGAAAKRQERETIDSLMEKLGFDFPYARSWDSLDFKEVNVEQLRDALVAAYRAGKKGG